MVRYDLTVNGMHCNSCRLLVTDALDEIGAKDIKVNVDEKKQVGRVSFEFAGSKSN